jgi:hypothetical protein
MDTLSKEELELIVHLLRVRLNRHEYESPAELDNIYNILDKLDEIIH